MQAAPPEAPPSAPARRRKPPLHLRARSVPYRRPFIVALLLSALFYLALVGTTAALFAFMVNANKNAASLLIGFGGSSSVLWLVSFLKRRTCYCPLCKGTPLADNSAHPHEKARRFFPLNHGTSNVIRAIVRQHFRCQYCGTPFDLLKPAITYRSEENARLAQPLHRTSLPSPGVSRS